MTDAERIKQLKQELAEARKKIEFLKSDLEVCMKSNYGHVRERDSALKAMADALKMAKANRDERDSALKRTEELEKQIIPKVLEALRVAKEDGQLNLSADAEVWSKALLDLDKAKNFVIQVYSALQKCKLTMFKSPEPFEPGDIELRADAIKAVNESENMGIGEWMKAHNAAQRKEAYEKAIQAVLGARIEGGEELWQRGVETARAVFHGVLKALADREI